MRSRFVISWLLLQKFCLFWQRKNTLHLRLVLSLTKTEKYIYKAAVI